MTRHYPDMGSASDWLEQISHAVWPIRSHIISMEFLRSFLRRHSKGTSGGVAKCWLFSQATQLPCWLSSLGKLQVIIEGLYAKRSPPERKWVVEWSQAKGHFFLWLKITWFLNVHVQLYMQLLNHSDNIHCQNLFFASLCLVLEKFDVKSWVWEHLLSKQENDCKKCALPTQFTTDGDSIFCLHFAKWRKCFSSKKLSLHCGCNLTTVSKVSEALPISLSWTRILELFCRKT